jgi:hypothetical protein
VADTIGEERDVQLLDVISLTVTSSSRFGPRPSTSISAVTSKDIHPFDHGAIRILLCDPADAKSALKYSEPLSFQVTVVGFSPTADFLLVQSFVLALHASSRRLP